MDIELTPALAMEALAAAGVEGRAMSASRLDGGVSNLTWRIDRDGHADSAAPVVLRLQRERGIFQPYDVLREARVLDCLAASPLPVPKVLGRASGDEQGSPLGAPYIVLEWLDFPHMGMVPMTAEVSESYRATVEAIHGLDWRALGLSFLDPPQPGPEAALRDLDAVHARAVAFSCDANPLIESLSNTLRDHLPDSPPPSLCHGDINVFNYLVGPDGAIAGVVDWEQANLGDPLSDWGLITALANLKGLDQPPESHPLAAQPFQSSGRQLRDLRYWMLHQLYKLAVIHQIWSQTGDSPPWYTWQEAEYASERATGWLLG